MQSSKTAFSLVNYLFWVIQHNYFQFQLLPNIRYAVLANSLVSRPFQPSIFVACSTLTHICTASNKCRGKMLRYKATVLTQE